MNRYENKDSNKKDDRKQEESWRSNQSIGSSNLTRQRYNEAFRNPNDPPDRDYYAEAQQRYKSARQEAESKRLEEEKGRAREERMFRMTEGTWSHSRGKNYRA
ncbi:hypothetical protein NH340_JMT00042 [Sarcoptes scabiei]|nr:hypothetical protein NH340_JMT00042 [Sarcoptes scabiei]